MSYDVSLIIDTGAPEDEWPTAVEIGNCTSNVSPMWRHALGGIPLRDFHGMSCVAAAGPLAEAVKRMEADPQTYRLMNPSNGWGDYEGALAYLRKLAAESAKHPKCRISIGC